MSYFNFKKRAPKSTNHQKLIRKLDDAFSEYIRLRDADEHGIVNCITCDDRHHYREIDCGHFVDRGHMATRYHLQNSNGQCRLCNSTHDGRAELHGKAIDLKYGEGTAEMLIKLGRQERHFTEHELQGMLEELRKEIKALKEEKFGI